MRGRGPGVSGCARRWRICGGRVGVVMVLGADVEEEERADFRREEINSFTVGGATCSTDE